MEENVRKILDKLKGSEKKDRLSGGGNTFPGGGSPGYGEEKRRARKLKESLMEEYEGAEIEGVADAGKIENEFGSVLYIEKEFPVDWRCPGDPPGEIRADLQLIYGIGPVTESELKEKGYETIEDLLDHPEWAERAESLLEKYDFSCPAEAKNLISRWKSASHPLHLTLAGFFERKNFALIDIETLGLTHQPIILFAIAVPEEEKTRVHQFLLKDIRQEPAALMEFNNFVEDKDAYLTYNGKRFDIPYINRRLNFYGLDGKLDGIHFDLYHFAKREWEDQLPDCSLNTVERQKLGIERQGDIPSELVPEFYKTYQNTGNPGPLVPLLEHSRQDVLSLQSIFRCLQNGRSKDNAGNRKAA